MAGEQVFSPQWGIRLHLCFLEVLELEIMYIDICIVLKTADGCI